MSNENTEVARTDQQGNRWLQPVGTKGTLQALLNDSRDAIQKILPKHITPDRILKMALIAAGREAKIYDCTARSVVDAIMRASELGLDFSGTLGEGYIIPFKRQATFIPGYRGYIRLARNSDQISTFEAHVVYEDDTFELEYGLKPRLVHIPNLTPPHKRIVLGAYAVVHFKDDTHQQEFMNLSQLESIRKRSKARDNGPWVTDTDEMYRKTVVRRIAKMLPLSPELETLRAYDNEVDHLDTTIGTALVDNLAAPDEHPNGSTSDQITDEIKSRTNGKAETAIEKPPPPPANDGDDSEELLDMRKELLNMSGDLKWNEVPGLNLRFQTIGEKIAEMTLEECQAEIANMIDLRTKREREQKRADEGKNGKQGKIEL